MAKDALNTLDFGDIINEDPTALNHVPHKEGDIDKVIDARWESLKRLFKVRGINTDDLDDEGAREIVKTLHLYSVMSWIYRRARREAKDRWDLLANDYENQFNALLERYPIPVKSSADTCGPSEVTADIRILR